MKLRVHLDELASSFAAANATQSWHQRSALRLTFTDADGNEGEGEASPLPGYSPDSLEDARAALSALDGIELDPAAPLETLPPLEASAAFAAEVAALDWASRRSGVPFASHLPRRHDSLPVAALVRDEAEGRARLAAGYRTLKLKIGRDLDAEIALARALHAEGAVLRFDANGALGPGQLDEVLTALAALDAELLEEPTVGSWPRPSPVPLAVDESLFADRSAALDRIERGEAAWALIKPMCLGGPRAVAELARAVHDAGGRVSFSHTFGGPIERAAVGAMALAFGDGAPGLAPHAGLHVWPAATVAAFAEATLTASGRSGLGLTWEVPW